MRISKLIGALFVMLAFSAIAIATTASAEELLWKWLPGSVGETMKGKSGKAVLRGTGGIAITCTKSLLLLEGSELIKEGSTESKDATLWLLTIHFEGCTAAGLPANSEGDASGIILVHVHVHNCKIGPNDWGVLLKPLPLHIEVPSVKLLVLVLGDVLGLLEAKAGEKLLTFKLNLKTVKSEGKEQELLLCEGSTLKEKLRIIHDANPEEDATEEAKEGVLEFDMTKDKEGEEIMEK